MSKFSIISWNVSPTMYGEHVKSCEAFATGRKYCLYCPRSFKQPTYLRKHMESTHGKVSAGAMPEAASGDEDSSETDLDSTSTESRDQDPKIDILVDHPGAGDESVPDDTKTVQDDKANTGDKASSVGANEGESDTLPLGGFLGSPPSLCIPRPQRGKLLRSSIH